MKTKDLIAEAMDLPVEDRALVADSILKSLNPPESDMDEKWTAVATQRLKELRSGEVEASKTAQENSPARFQAGLLSRSKSPFV